MTTTPGELVDYMQTHVLSNPDKWIKYKYSSDDGTQHCLVGALFVAQTQLRAPDSAYHAAQSALSDAVGKRDPYRRECRISVFNDHSSTTFEDIRAVLDDAKEILT